MVEDEIVVVHSLSHVWLFLTPWTAACQASLSFIISWSLLKLVHWVYDAIQPSHLLLSPSPPAPNLSQYQSFPMSRLFIAGGQSIGASALASVLPMNSQGWFPWGLTSLISLLSKDYEVEIAKGSCKWRLAFTKEVKIRALDMRSCLYIPGMRGKA